MKYLQNHQEIRALSTEKLIQYTEEFLKEHPNSQLVSLLAKVKEGKTALVQPLVSGLVAQHNEKNWFKVVEVKAEEVTKEKAEESAKVKYLDNTTIEVLQDVYVNNVLSAAVEEFGEKIAVSLAIAIRNKRHTIKINSEGLDSGYVPIFSRLVATNRNDDPRLGLFKLADIYSAVYGVEILGQGVFGAVDLSTDEKVAGAKAEASKVIGDALDAFISKFKQKEDYERDLEATLAEVSTRSTTDTLWIVGIQTAAGRIQQQIVESIQKAIIYHQRGINVKKEEAVSAVVKLLANKENSKYFNRSNSQNLFVQYLAVLGSQLDPDSNIAILSAVSLGTKLHLAVSQGKLELVRKLVAEGADINAKDVDGDTPLSVAIKCDRADIVGFLMQCQNQQSHLDVETISNAIKAALRDGYKNAIREIQKFGVKLDPNWLLDLAKEQDDIKALKTLLELGVDVNYQNQNGVTALHNACRKGNAEAVKILLEKGARQDLVTHGASSTPLDWAKLTDNNAVIKLLEAKAEKKQQAFSSTSSSKPEPTALHKAIADGDFEAVTKLFVDKVDVNYKDRDGDTPAMIACMCGNAKSLKLLIDAKADLNLRSNHGFTALMKACTLDSKEAALECAKLIIDAGADLTVSTSNNTALDIARKLGNFEVVNLIKNKLGENLYEPAKSGDFKKVAHLIDNGANTNFQKPDGSTALHIAAFNGHLNIVDGLLSPGNANPNLARTDGRTPLHFACLGGREKVVERLLACTAIDLALKTVGGKTALDFAKEKGHTKIVEMLEAPARSASASTSSGFSISIDMTAQLTRALQNSALGGYMNQR